MAARVAMAAGRFDSAIAELARLDDPARDHDAATVLGPALVWGSERVDVARHRLAALPDTYERRVADALLAALAGDDAGARAVFDAEFRDHRSDFARALITSFEGDGTLPELMSDVGSPVLRVEALLAQARHLALDDRLAEAEQVATAAATLAAAKGYAGALSWARAIGSGGALP